MGKTRLRGLLASMKEVKPFTDARGGQLVTQDRSRHGADDSRLRVSSMRDHAVGDELLRSVAITVEIVGEFCCTSFL